jgi:Xaa-Pro aminopeptidase
LSLYEKRVERAQKLMQKAEIDYLFLGGGTDIKYLLNYQHGESERLGVFVLPSKGKGTYIGPKFEMPRFELGKINVFYDLLPWEEHEDPLEKVASVLDLIKPVKIAVSDTHQARFLVRYLERFPLAEIVSAYRIMGEMRVHKDKQEIEYLIHLGKALDKSWEKTLELKFSGRKESELGQDLQDIKMEVFRGFHDPPVNMSTMSGRPATGINSSSAHGGGGDRVIQKGDPFWWECGSGNCMGYVGDKTRSAQVGPGTAECEKIYKKLQDVQQKVSEAVKPGITCESLDLLCKKLMKKAGVAQFMDHRVGHGLGMDGHEYPYIVQGNNTVIESGMVFSVEPGIYIPGKWGLRIEDIIYVTDSGCESFFHSSKDYNVVK